VLPHTAASTMKRRLKRLTFVPMVEFRTSCPPRWRRFHSVRAASNSITNTSRGGLPILASDEHRYLLDLPNRGRSVSNIFSRRVCKSSRSIPSFLKPYIVYDLSTTRSGHICTRLFGSRLHPQIHREELEVQEPPYNLRLDIPADTSPGVTSFTPAFALVL
jgi:hypothetical protein